MYTIDVRYVCKIQLNTWKFILLCFKERVMLVKLLNKILYSLDVDDHLRIKNSRDHHIEKMIMSVMISTIIYIIKKTILLFFKYDVTTEFPCKFV